MPLYNNSSNYGSNRDSLAKLLEFLRNKRSETSDRMAERNLSRFGLPSGATPPSVQDDTFNLVPQGSGATFGAPTPAAAMPDEAALRLTPPPTSPADPHRSMKPMGPQGPSLNPAQALNQGGALPPPPPPQYTGTGMGSGMGGLPIPKPKPTDIGGEGGEEEGGFLSGISDYLSGLGDDLSGARDRLFAQPEPEALSTEDPGFFRKLGNLMNGDPWGATAAESGRGSFMSELQKPGRQSLLRAGLATMQAAGQPGATGFGSIGTGGLAGLDYLQAREQQDYERDLANRTLDYSTAMDMHEAGLARVEAANEIRNSESLADYRSGQTRYTEALINNLPAELRDAQARTAASLMNAQASLENATTNRERLNAEEAYRVDRDAIDAFQSIYNNLVDEMTADGLIDMTNPQESQPLLDQARSIATNIVAGLPGMEGSQFAIRAAQDAQLRDISEMTEQELEEAIRRQLGQ